ncbi:MAG TPA: hypothetical protein VFP80_00330 [Thermoanaerobaculia bacterium]|nr:hypothetical protein [Thermoanaerobaculia bacterium]
MDPRDLLLANWSVIERIIAYTCRLKGLAGADAEDFASLVKVKLLENDCAIVRQFRGDSKFSSYISVVIQRTYVDLCIQQTGKYHPSRAAMRMGDVAVDLERLIHRDGLSIDAAIARVQEKDPSMTRAALEGYAAGMPDRRKRQQPMPLDEVVETRVASDARADVLIVDGERRKLSERAAEVVRNFIGGLAERDRLLLQLLFEAGLQLTQIARILKSDVKPLYRRRDRLLAEIAAALAAAGITEQEILDIVGNVQEEMDFGLRMGTVCPTESEESERAGQGC